MQAWKERETFIVFVTIDTVTKLLYLSLLFIVLFTVPLQVTGVRVVNNDTVEWSPLVNSDRGSITKYQVKFFSNVANGRIIDVDSNDVTYQANITEDFPPLGQPVLVVVSIITFVH